MSRNSRRRENLLKQGTTCHWCGVELVYVRADTWPKGAMPDNFATVDHLYDRLTYPDREHTAPRHVEQTVLACRACNQRRNRERQIAIAAESRSGRTPDSPRCPGREAHVDTADGADDAPNGDHDNPEIPCTSR